MTIRPLTRADAVWALPLAQNYTPGHLSLQQIEAWLELPQSAAFGDPDAQHTYGDGICGIANHELLGSDWAAGEPASVRTALSPLRGKRCTQILLLAPLPFGEPGGPAWIYTTMLPLLKRIIHEMRVRFPVVANRPIWAALPLAVLNFMRDGAGPLTAPFPNTVVVPLGDVTKGIGYIPRLQDADT